MPVFSFNGGEGVGKTTVISEIEKVLTKRGLEVKVFQAFGTTIGGHVRKMIKEDSFKSNLQKATLKFAALVDTWSEIKEVLKANPKTIVLLDRDFLSFAAYDMFIDQNLAAVDLMEEMQQYLTDERMIPDCSFTLVCPDDIVESRLQGRKQRLADELHSSGIHIPETDVNDDNFRNINPYVLQGIMFKHEFLARRHHVLDTSVELDEVVSDIISLMGVKDEAVH